MSGAQAITVAVPTEVLKRLESLEALVVKLRDDVNELRDTRSIDALKASVDLVADRLGTLLGGPSLTELMDRMDELERTVAEQAAAPKRRRPLKG